MENNEAQASVVGSSSPLTMDKVAVVTIGRNEGERFIACVESLSAPEFEGLFKVYVDSGSTDGSVDVAKNAGWTVVELDMSRPFTMARGRNAGFEAVKESGRSIDAVQFIDGDCVVDANWLPKAIYFLNQRSDVASVAGYRRERFPDASLYNAMCDMEWHTSDGEVDSVGGDALIRVSAFAEVSGFDSFLIAGEEPELCYRLRQAGWIIWRLPVSMTYHDARILTAGQWFKRVKRAGYAFARVHWKHRAGAEGFWAREVRSILIWGGLFPLLFVLGLFISCWLSAAMVALYGVQWLRISRSEHVQRFDRPFIYALFCMLGKPVEFSGIAKCYMALWRGRSETLIEYKE